MSTYTGVSNFQKQSGFLAYPVYCGRFAFSGTDREDNERCISYQHL